MSIACCRNIRQVHSPRIAAGPVVRRAFTIVELLVVMGLVAALSGVVILIALQTKSTANSLGCLGQLRQVTAALRSYAWANENRFPDPGAAEKPWEAIIAPYLPGPDVLRCPADSEVAPITNSSYDWRDTTLPESTLAGRLMTDVKRMEAVLTLEALPGWHKKEMINVGRVDGSCLEMDAQKAMADLLQPVR